MVVLGIKWILKYFEEGKQYINGDSVIRPGVILAPVFCVNFLYPQSPLLSLQQSKYSLYYVEKC